MDTLKKKLEESLNEHLLKITISNPRRAEEIRKYSIRPVLLREQICFQVESHTKTQVFHENLDKEETLARLADILPLYKQVQIRTESEEATALINKKGKASIRSDRKKTEGRTAKNASGRTGDSPAKDTLGRTGNFLAKDTPGRTGDFPAKDTSGRTGAVRIDPRREKPAPGAPDLSRLLHNRPKHYILAEGRPVPFLKDLGVMTAEGKIVRSKYDKYRQINRFLEFIEDVIPHLAKDREITILDFGCGKSYLTFAVYYYLRELKGYDVRIIGLDLKKDVIRKCSRLAEKYGYEKLKFYEGSIEEFEGVSHVDMVITLHACDTATDYALYKAVRWGADVILSVPCCQHELNGQLSAGSLRPVTDYGILKERFAAMATDAIRGGLLEGMGYETQILEFIEMEHTPKNLLIRAVRGTRPSEKRWKETLAFCEEFGLKPTLQTLLEEERGR